ncbi:Unknown protein [Striga hermonthica]|uniref:DUF1985 domain-containing protein n=1 Tax=Striga hermonthica TaxID=68872 RepID=A0A9N7RKB7_STRHE|nr:Unknown protein [Striga hermonthica]
MANTKFGRSPSSGDEISPHRRSSSRLRNIKSHKHPTLVQKKLQFHKKGPRSEKNMKSPDSDFEDEIEAEVSDSEECSVDEEEDEKIIKDKSNKRKIHSRPRHKQSVDPRNSVEELNISESVKSKSNEIWFDFGGKLLRFGIDEFALITGLKCIGSTQKLNIPKVKQGLYDKYFAEDSHRVERCYLDVIDGSDFDEYPWGVDVFEFTFQYLKKSIRNRQQMHNNVKADGSSYLYRCYGLIIALQIWFYEICKTADGIVCKSLEGQPIPRLLKWEVQDNFNRLFMERAFSNLDSSKFKNVSPTPAEKQALLLEPFFSNKNEFTRNELQFDAKSQNSNDSEVINRLNTISRDLDNLKQLFFDFPKRVIAELELFKETFIGRTNQDNADSFDKADHNIDEDVHNSPVGIEAIAMKEKQDSIMQHGSDKTPKVGIEASADAMKHKPESVTHHGSDKHMDVLFYYLRKIGMYGTNAPLRFTTTDTLFDQHIRALYSTFL